MDEQQAKQYFAQSWLQLSDPLQAALRLADRVGFDIDTIWISETWIHDDDVLAYKADCLRKANEADPELLPTKAQAARTLWAHLQTMRGDSKTKAIVAYAELMGYVEKPSPVGINQTIKQAVLPQDKQLLKEVISEVIAADDC